MIKDGIIQDKFINGIPVIVDLIPKTNTMARPAYLMKAESITVHNTGNSSKGADAKSHTVYVKQVKAYIGWHFVVDDKQIIQNLPIIENAWHAGDGGNGDGNRKSIGIETCEHEGIDWRKAKDNAINVINYLFDNVSTIENTYPHQHWNGKYCPHKILDEGWDLFMEEIENARLIDDVFQDFNLIPDWAKADIRQAKERDIVKGDTDGKFNPYLSITRLESTVIANRVINFILETINKD